jgi:transcriptional regulator with XRE-family HTH domain
MELLSRLKERRQELNLTQAEVSALAGVSLRTLKQIENCQGNPTLETIQKVANLLGLTLKLELTGKT